MDLEKHYNRIADFKHGLEIEQLISKEELNNKESFWKECWTFDVDESDKKNHQISYCYTIRIVESEFIIVLNTNEAYDNTKND